MQSSDGEKSLHEQQLRFATHNPLKTQKRDARARKNGSLSTGRDEGLSGKSRRFPPPKVRLRGKAMRKKVKGSCDVVIKLSSQQ